MIINTIKTSDCTPQTIVIGRRTTHDTLQVVFDLSYLAETYGSGAAVLVVKRSQDETAYPATITQEGNTLTWTITEVDTYYVGAGECELMWYVNNGLAKTIIYPVVVMRDILQTTEEPPDAYENWVESLTALGAETQQHALDAAQSATEAETAQGKAEDAQAAAEAAQDAAEKAATKAEEASAHAPIIVNGYWYAWDATTEAYQNTGVKAEGRNGTDGFSPIITVTDITGGHRVTITDADGTQTVNVMNGTDGTDGTDGFSPTVTITTITGGHRVTITDETHPTGQSFDVMDGQDGASDAGEVTYDDTATYPSGSVGAALTNQLNAISQLSGETLSAEKETATLSFVDTHNYVTKSYNPATDEITVSCTNKASTFAGASTLQGTLHLTAGKTYRFHAVGETISGDPPMIIAIRGAEGNISQIVNKLEGSGEQTLDFIATGYESYCTIFARFNGSAAATSCKYSDVWIAEVLDTAVDVSARNQIADDADYVSDIVTLTNYSASRLCSPMFTTATDAEFVKDLWLSDNDNYDITLYGNNSIDYSNGAELVRWGATKEEVNYAIEKCSYTYFYFFIRNKNNTSADIHPTEVYLRFYPTTNLQSVVQRLDIANLNGKTFAVFCDSIGTHGNSGKWCNVPEITITEDDVGVQLSAYLTHYDLYSGATQQDPVGTLTGMTLGGVALTEEQIGTEITFTPIAEDVGKSVGKVYDWNGNTLNVWWSQLAEHYGMTPIPVCWASSSYSSHEESVQRLMTAYAWHDAQIRKAGIRTPGTMTRTAPDYVILARGCNDMTHSPYDKLTSGFFDDVDWDFPASDVVSNGYGLKEAIALTIKKIWQAYPLAKIILCTIPYVGRIDYNNFPTNNDDTSYPQWNEAIRECAEFFGCGLIDFAKDGVTHANLTTFVPDRTHPNAAGHTMMAKQAIKDMTLC